MIVVVVYITPILYLGIAAIVGRIAQRKYQFSSPEFEAFGLGLIWPIWLFVLFGCYCGDLVWDWWHSKPQPRPLTDTDNKPIKGV